MLWQYSGSTLAMFWQYSGSILAMLQRYLGSTHFSVILNELKIAYCSKDKLSKNASFNATFLFFRSIRFEYDSEVNVDGARGYRYKLRERLVSNSTLEPENACFNPSPMPEQVRFSCLLL